MSEAERATEEQRAQESGLSALVVNDQRSPSLPSEREVPGELRREARPSEIVERASVAERRIFALEERLHDVELRLREQVESERQRALEMRAVERDVAVKEAYAQRLEVELASVKEQLHAHVLEVQRLDTHIRAQNDVIAQHTAAREAAEQRAAELGALVGTIQQQASYRAAVALNNRLRRAGPLYGVARRVARSALGR
ncbi:MAG: hypothetical protein M0004_10555 [Actinomycetota bacterium]|nr:hypothetical protein [Actinomycetota bacterium]